MFACSHFCVCVYGCGFIIMTDSSYTESIRMKKKIIDSKFVNQFLFLLIQSLFVCWSSHIMNTFEGLLSLWWRWWRWWLLQLSLIFTNFFFSRFSFPCHINHGYLLMVTRFWKSAKKHHCWPSSSSYVIYNNSHLHFGRKKKFETVNNHKRDSISLQLLLWLFMIEIDIEENRLFLSLDADLFRILFFLSIWWPFYFILLFTHTNKLN